jgi:hypothetical protein
MKQATDTMAADPEVYMRQVAKDVEDESFDLNETHKYMSFNACMRLLGHIGHYNDHCETYDAERFEDYAERIDCVLGSVKPKWRGYAIVFILNECIEKAKTDDTFDDRIENHVMFWKNHLFRQPYIGTISRYSQYTDLLVQAIRLEGRHEDVIKRKAVEERYVTYMWRVFESFSKEELVAAKERLAPHKEGIMMAAWHPDRVARWMEAGVLDDM